jgi:hypothetical protein
MKIVAAMMTALFALTVGTAYAADAKKDDKKVDKKEEKKEAKK